MHIIIAADITFLCSFSARKYLILPTECSPQKSLILLEILLAEFIQAYLRTDFIYDITKDHVRESTLSQRRKMDFEMGFYKHVGIQLTLL